MQPKCFQKFPKQIPQQFLHKIIIFKIALKVDNVLGLLLKTNLLPKTFKNGPIWSHRVGGRSIGIVVTRVRYYDLFGQIFFDEKSYTRSVENHGCVSLLVMAVLTATNDFICFNNLICLKKCKCIFVHKNQCERVHSI